MVIFTDAEDFQNSVCCWICHDGKRGTRYPCGLQPYIDPSDSILYLLYPAIIISPNIPVAD
jgi:hypothetical protein